MSLVYNGVDLRRFHPDSRARKGEAAREALGMPREAWMILFVGSGFERKGLGPLLEGVARFADRRSWLVVAGRGDTRPYRARAGRLGLAERLIWVGERPDVEHFYAAADVVALPALYEPFGNVHLEALAAGVPVLSSARAGGSELITSGLNGWVIPTPTAQAVAEGLQALREADPEKLTEAARASAEPFTHAAQADGFEALYGRLTR